MRRIGAVLLISSVVLAGTSAATHGGEADVDDNGNFLITDANVSPPVTSTRNRPQPVTFELSQMFGNYRNGQQPPRSTELRVQLPRGMKVNSAFATRCPLPTSDAEVRPDRCPASSRIGGGTALADARNLGVLNPVPATLTAYNGARFQGDPTLILQGEAQVGGNPVTTEYNFRIRRGGAAPFGLQAITFHPYPVPPPTPGEGYITLNSLTLRMGKTVTRRLRGRRVRRGLLEAPRRCPRSGWAFSSRFTLETGSVLEARSNSPCTRRR